MAALNEICERDYDEYYERWEEEYFNQYYARMEEEYYERYYSDESRHEFDRRPYPRTRPDFGPMQVRSPKQLIYGWIYAVVDATGTTTYIRFKRIEGQKMVFAYAERGKMEYSFMRGEHTRHLSDAGLVSYGTTWNPSNHVLRTPRSSQFVITPQGKKVLRQFWR